MACSSWIPRRVTQPAGGGVGIRAQASTRVPVPPPLPCVISLRQRPKGKNDTGLSCGLVVRRHKHRCGRGRSGGRGSLGVRTAVGPSCPRSIPAARGRKLRQVSLQSSKVPDVRKRAWREKDEGVRQEGDTSCDGDTEFWGS